MKKIIIIFLAAVLTFLMGSAVMASTMGVNISKGYEIDFERDLYFSAHDSDYWTLRGNYAPNDKVLFKLGYNYMDDRDSEDSVAFGVRYKLVNNLALVCDYSDCNGSSDSDFDLGLRGKIDINKYWALTGELTYNNPSGPNDDYAHFWGQFEYKLGEVGALNAGYNWQSRNSSDNDCGIVGAEFYIKKFTIYLDYYIYDHHEDNNACIGVCCNF